MVDEEKVAGMKSLDRGETLIFQASIVRGEVIVGEKCRIFRQMIGYLGLRVWQM
jgi:hypothetical protein